MTQTDPSYLTEEIYSRNALYWTGILGILIGNYAIQSIPEAIIVLGTWLIGDMALYAYRNDVDLVKLKSGSMKKPTGGENQ